MSSRGRRFLAVLFLSLAGAGATWAHHSYAMFDSQKTLTVSGTVAKLEWSNPHVFVWVYVEKNADPGKYELYAFENGTPNGLEPLGWNRTTPRAGERISVKYAPLRDGRKGGHWIVGTLADGRILRGAGGPASRMEAPPVPPNP